MRSCGKCRGAYYCSEECQLQDWKRHREVCSEESGRSVLLKKIHKNKKFFSFLERLCRVCKEDTKKNQEKVIVCIYVFGKGGKQSAVFYGDWLKKSETKRLRQVLNLPEEAVLVQLEIYCDDETEYRFCTSLGILPKDDPTELIVLERFPTKIRPLRLEF